MDPEAWIEDSLAERRTQHRERRDRVWPHAGVRLHDGSRTWINFSGNDYLGLAADSRLKDGSVRAVQQDGCGATASRLICGTLTAHRALEEQLAAFKGYPSSLLAGSGYLASLGLMQALAGRDDLIVMDRLAHACLLDGAVLSRARVVRFHHNNVEHARELLARSSAKRKILATESVFSMDGDLAPLADLATVAAEAGALFIVDEAHATGVFGGRGEGLVSALGLQDRVHGAITTFSKALGGYGGAVSGSLRMRSWLLNQARATIYTTAPPPAVVGAASAALRILKEEPGLGERLLERSARLRAALHARGFDTGRSASPIIPIHAGTDERAMRLSARLEEAGYLVVAIRPPTVPEGTARLRISLSLAHTDAECDGLIDALDTAARQEGLL